MRCGWRSAIGRAANYTDAILMLRRFCRANLIILVITRLILIIVVGVAITGFPNRLQG